MKLRFAIIASMLIAGLGGWLLLHPTSAAPSSTEVKLYLSPSQLSAEQGKTFSEAIRLSKSGNEKVDYVSAHLTFPAKLVTVKSVSSSGGAFNNGTGLKVAYSNSNGTLSATGSGNALADQADVLVVTITFVAQTAGQASLKFSSSSQAGALLGNNSVKNALDTMIGSVVNIIATAGTPSPTQSGSSSPNQPSPTGSGTKSEPAITAPAARPESTTSLNDAPMSDDAVGVPVSDAGVVTNDAQVSRMWPWTILLWLCGIMFGVIGILAAWLFWLSKKHPQRLGGDESDSEIISPQSTDTTDNEPEADTVPDLPFANEPATPVSETERGTFGEGVSAATQPVTSGQSATSTQPVAIETAPASTTAPAAGPDQGSTQKTPTSPLAPAKVTTPTVPTAQSSQTSQSSSVPDMFDDGEKRLKSEGL